MQCFILSHSYEAIALLFPISTDLIAVPALRTQRNARNVKQGLTQGRQRTQEVSNE